MRRYATLTAIALVLACSAGCHHWPTRHAAPVAYSDCYDPCASGASVVRPINSMSGPPVVSKVLPAGIASPQYP
jgi:hypothetical protein